MRAPDGERIAVSSPPASNSYSNVLAQLAPRRRCASYRGRPEGQYPKYQSPEASVTRASRPLLCAAGSASPPEQSVTPAASVPHSYVSSGPETVVTESNRFDASEV